MPDMLVKLYELPEYKDKIRKLEKKGVIIRRAIPPEKHLVLEWIAENFDKGWRSEADIAFSKSPLRIFIAHQDDEILGFACYDTTAKGFFGPTGVSKKARKRGIGTALLLRSLAALKESGYAYAVIGGAGPVKYYQKVCKASVIEGSEDGIYKNILS